MGSLLNILLAPYRCNQKKINMAGVSFFPVYVEKETNAKGVG